MAIMRRITEINGEIIMVENYDYCRQYNPLYNSY